MLAIRLGQSLPSSAPVNWMPTDETGLIAWFRKASGMSIGGGTVSQWKDGSGNAHTMTQPTVSEQPAFAAGQLTFDPDQSDNLQLASTQISLTEEFTIGVALNITSGGGIILGDNTTTGEFIKVFSTTKIRVKIDNATAVDLQLDSGSLVGTDSTLILTRNGSDLITMYWNGVAQADTETLTGTADIDSIGVRATDANPYDGLITEIQIYESTSAALTANVHNRLASL